MNFDPLGFLEGLVNKFGAATAKLALVPSPDGKNALGLVRAGYQAIPYPGRTEPRPAHWFHDLGDFAAYLNRHAKDRPRCDILVAPTEARAVFDHDDPQSPHIGCRLRWHPDYEAWMGVLGKPLDIAALHDHVRAVMPTFTALEDGEVPVGEMLLGQLSKLEVIKGGALKVSVAANGLIEFAGAEDKTTVTGRFPDRFTVVLPVYESILNRLNEPDTYTLEVLLSLKIVNGAPVFTFRAPRHEVVELDALRGAVAYLRGLLDESFLVGVGEARSCDVSVGPVT